MNLVNVAYLAFQYPAELPTHLERGGKLTAEKTVVITLVALSIATGSYYMRGQYASSFSVVIPTLAVLMGLLLLVGSLLLGGVIDILVGFVSPSKTGRAGDMMAIALFAALPFIFFLPAAVPVRLLPYRGGVMFFVELVLSGWSLFILLRGVQFLYELSTRRAIGILVRAMAVLAFFPGLLLVAATSIFLQVLN